MRKQRTEMCKFWMMRKLQTKVSPIHQNWMVNKWMVISWRTFHLSGIFQWWTLDWLAISSTLNVSTNALTFVKNIRFSSESWVGTLAWTQVKLRPSRCRWWQKIRTSYHRQLTASIKSQFSLASNCKISTISTQSHNNSEIKPNLKMNRCFIWIQDSPDDVTLSINSGILFISNND